MDIIAYRFDVCYVLKVSSRVDGATAAQLEDSFRAITVQGRHGIVFGIAYVFIIRNQTSYQPRSWYTVVS